MGHTYRLLKRYTEAETSYTEAARLNPKSADAIYWLGMIYGVIQKKPEAARAQYEKLKLIDSTRAEKLLGFITAK